MDSRLRGNDQERSGNKDTRHCVLDAESTFVFKSFRIASSHSALDAESIYYGMDSRLRGND